MLMTQLIGLIATESLIRASCIGSTTTDLRELHNAFGHPGLSYLRVRNKTFIHVTKIGDVILHILKII